MRIIVVGANAAGLSAASKARRLKARKRHQPGDVRGRWEANQLVEAAELAETAKQEDQRRDRRRQQATANAR